MPKKSKNWLLKHLSWIIPSFLMAIILVIIILFATGVLNLPSFSTTQTIIIETDETNGAGTSGTTVNLFTTCLEVCNSEGWTDGWDSLFEDGHDCIMAGANFIEYGYPNEDPLLICCCDNIPEPVDELQPGDVLGSGGGDFLVGVDSLVEFEFQLTEGDYQGDICAEIERRSSKVDPNCNPTGDLEDWNNFIFLDSFETVWERSDQILAGVSEGTNTYGNPDVVSVRWNGTPFHGFLHHFGDCPMNMEIRVTIVVC